MTTPNPLKITEVALRDAHQSLLATRMRTSDMIPIAEKLDRVGFWSLEMWGGATFDSCIRYMNEDPWERLRLLRKAMPNTKFQMLLRGQNILGYRHYSDDIVERFVEKAAENGIDIFRIFDALNDTRNIRTAVKAVKSAGKIVQGAISYTVSPVHTIEKFVTIAEEMRDLGVDSICIKDMAALLAPQPAYDLITAIKQKVALPVQLHTHCTSGMALMTIMKAIDAGVDILDTAISSLSLGTSHSPTETIVSVLQGTPRDTGLDLNILSEIGAYFAGVRKKYSKFESSFTGIDVNILKYQVPGGMLSNLESQLREQKALDKLQEVLDEIPVVRRELGYIPLVTPTSQIVGTQATLNIITGKRYKIIASETAAIVRGEYGSVPGEIDPDLKKRVLGDDKEPLTCRPADMLEPEFDKLKAEIAHLAKSDEDVLTYALFPKVAEKFFQSRHRGPISVEEETATLNAAQQTQPAAQTQPTQAAQGIPPVATAPMGVPIHPGMAFPFPIVAATAAAATAAGHWPVAAGAYNVMVDGKNFEVRVAEAMPAQPVQVQIQQTIPQPVQVQQIQTPAQPVTQTSNGHTDQPVSKPVEKVKVSDGTAGGARTGRIYTASAFANNKPAKE